LFQFEDWTYFGDGGSAHVFNDFERTAPLARWVHLELTLHLATPAKATLTVDGVAAPEISFALPSAVGGATIGLGDEYLVGEPYAFYLDNFTATVE
jgi:hypothetical protein